MEKVKTKKYFQNFFIISVLFHLMLLTLLNIQRVHKISFVKDYFVNKFPQVEIFNVQPKEIEPQQMEAKVYPQIKPVTDLVKVIKETGKEEPMGKMPIDERALLVKQVNSEPMDIKIDILKKGFNNEIAEEKEVSLFFNNAGINNGIEKNKSWINSGEENIIEEFNRKKILSRFHYDELNPNKSVNMGIVERSDKITITTVEVWIDSGGKVIKAEILKSSGHIELDQLALNSIRKRDFIPNRVESIRIVVIEIDFTNIR